jgi:hypothetical protein
LRNSAPFSKSGGSGRRGNDGGTPGFVTISTR